ncbi:MAG: phytoene desaturase [Candidatus Eremiobacteraeota bacterium]|nr:phytoene desaturase [Candidatus Eremiobacteraeota bacterium]
MTRYGTAKTAVVIGSGIGGIALGIRLQSLGIATTIVEKLDAPGGRAYVRRADGYTFDMGPTVLTVPHFIEELFALERGKPRLDEPDFPASVLDGKRITSGISSGPKTSEYVTLVPVLPFYRIVFDDGTHFDYDGDPTRTRAQVEALAPGDVRGYERFHAAAEAIFTRGFLGLGYTYFGSVGTMLRIVPDLLRLGAVQPLYRFVSKFVRSDKLRAVLSFESLLVGGNPLKVPAIYAMIHFVEKTWGIHFALGGTGALVRAFLRKFEELGGTIRYGCEVTKIEVEGGTGKPRARGVVLAGGERIAADLVASNGDYAGTYGLIERKYRRTHPDLRLALVKQSMSVVVIYFGFRADPERDANLRHHNIILGPRYAGLLKDIFDRKVLSPDFSQYLHVPTLTDSSMAPPGHHAAYTLVPVPHNGSGIDWTVEGPKLVDKVIAFLDEREHIAGLRERLTTSSFITPDYFATVLNSRLGNAFGLEPIFAQSAFFRPHNRSEDVAGLYLVGANTQPGGGTPAVMMSAKMTARTIARDFGLDAAPPGGGKPRSEAPRHAP